MRTRRKTGFTLVEILIVVVILGILAAIVIPQFTSASQEAIKGALKSQIQTISSQIELYRVKNAGQMVPIPGAVLVTPEFGWGELVSLNYLKEAPFNGYTSSADVDSVAPIDPGAGVRPPSGAGNPGWAVSATGHVYAVGYNAELNLLTVDAGWAPPAFN